MPDKRKNPSPFCTKVPIRSHAFRTLGAGAARNRETMELSEHWYWYQVDQIVRGYKYTIKANHSQLFIVNSDQLQLSPPFLMCLVTLTRTLLTSLLFGFFAIFRTVSKVKKKVCFGKKFCTFKIL